MNIKNIEWLNPSIITDVYNTIVVDRCKAKNHTCHPPTADGKPIGNHDSSRLKYYLEGNTLGRVYEDEMMNNSHSTNFLPITQEEVEIKVNNIRSLLYDSEIFVLEKQKKGSLYNVSTKYPLIFVHTPKTAGTSLNKVLDIGEDEGGHKTVKFLKSILDKSVYESHKKVSIIRNPFDRLVSLYKATEPQFIDMANEKGFGGKDYYSFEAWFWDIVSHVNNITSEPLFYMSCYDIMTDESGKLDIDYVIRFENLEEDLKNMFNDMGFDVPTLPKLNMASKKHPDLFESREKKHYSEYYECSTKDVIIDFVYEIFKKDFDAFGYKFEEKQMEKINETN